ncbi:hypothetical protein [Williamsia soli]|uniref:hypothetical protein n=1 Tax=Williamsia soli TaxID=364929 RepID=UPI001A9E99FC|nr:hypothetical protein [Williamsia soli]
MSPLLQVTLGGAAGGAFGYCALTLLPWRDQRIVLALNAFSAALLAVAVAGESQTSWSLTATAVGFCGASSSFVVMSTLPQRFSVQGVGAVFLTVLQNVAISALAAVDAYLISHVIYSVYGKLT